MSVAILGSVLACAVLVLGPAAAAQCQVVKLHSPNPSNGGWFGSGVSIDGDRLLVGAERDDAAGTNAGAAYVFRRSDDTWTLEFTILPSLPANQRFATAVALDGDTALIGAPSSTSLPSIAYVHRHDDAGTPADPSDDTWPLQDTLPVPPSGSVDDFGSAVALSGDYALIGDPSAHQTSTFAPGAAYLLRRDDAATPADPADDTWVQQVTFVGPKQGSFFGASVAIEGLRAVVGAWGEDTAAGASAGAGYVFERDDHGTLDPTDDTWPLRARLAPNDAAASQHFGKDVALSGDRIVVGALGDSQDGSFAGAGYVFQIDDDAWLQTAKLHGPNPAPFDNLGGRVALQGDSVALSSKHGAASPSFIGTAYLFRLDAAGALESAAGEVTAATVSTLEMRVALDGADLLIGEPFDGELGSEAGAARVFAIEQAPWTFGGAGLAGAAGEPCLFGAGPLTSPSPYSVSVHHGAPSALAFLLLGASALNAPFKGGVLVPSPDRVLALTLDADGAASLSGTWLGGFPSGFDFFLQAWMPDAGAPEGYAATNSVSVTTP